MLLALGTGCTKKSTESNPAAEPKNQNRIRLERSKDAESALQQMGFRAWVFKYEGGIVNSEVTIRYRTPGDTGEGRVVARSLGDVAVVVGTRRAEGKVEAGSTVKGMIVVAFPDEISGFIKGRVFHSHKLNNASSGRRVSLKDILPADSFQASTKKLGDGATIGAGSDEMSTGISQLSPGDSEKVAECRFSVGPERPRAKGSEILSITLTVTALKDGQLPDRKTVSPKK